MLPGARGTNKVKAVRDLTADPLPVFWPHVRQVTAACRPAAPADITSITGSPVWERWACCPAGAHFFSAGTEVQWKKSTRKGEKIKGKLIQKYICVLLGAGREGRKSIENKNLHNVSLQFKFWKLILGSCITKEQKTNFCKVNSPFKRFFPSFVRIPHCSDLRDYNFQSNTSMRRADGLFIVVL